MPSLSDEEDICELVEVGDERKYLKVKCGDKFKCPRSDTLYSVELYTDDPIWNRWSTNCTLKYDALCPNDHKFYEVCGHSRSGCEAVMDVTLETKFCRTYPCQHKNQQFTYMKELITFGTKIISGAVNTRYASCNGEITCSNTEVDEAECPNGDQAYVCHGETDTLIQVDKVCDLKCDCYRCNDEALCNNHTYGVICNSDLGRHVHAMYNCNNFTLCEENEDEALCSSDRIIRYCTPGDLHGPDFYNFFPNNTRPLFPHQICATPRLGPYTYTCQDGMDQVNCTDVSRVSMECEVGGYRTSLSVFALCMECEVGGYRTSLSVFALCMGYDLCLDGYQNQCNEVEGGCLLHKIELCDGKPDCPDGTDESTTFCSTISTTRCVRRATKTPGNRTEIAIPLTWIMDGQVDCEDGIDEIEEHWLRCGEDFTKRYVEKSSACQDVFLCDTEDTLSKFVTFEDLCDKIETCGLENNVCEKAKNLDSTWNVVPGETVKRLSYCLYGLESVAFLKGPCKSGPFEGPDKGILGVSTFDVVGPSQKQDCKFAYGELYVYLSCTGACNEAICPLNTVEQTSCSNIPAKSQVFSLTEDYRMTIVAKSRGEYVSKYFSCDNKICITYDKVCNLVNDCGDHSDERDCGNHFRCSETGEYIPKTLECDGTGDCRDYSDECGDSCSESSRNLLKNMSLKVFSWVSGILAITLNLSIIGTHVKEIIESESLRARVDKLLILLIAVGDFLVGCYLLSIAAVDFHYKGTFCLSKYQWLTSRYCNTLGVISTIGSQLSLFSMACLSISRLANINSLVAKDPTSWRARLKVLVMVMFLLSISLALAFLPLLEGLEDFFVNGLHYSKVTLFTGMVDKDTHYRILQSYNGRYKNQPLSWIRIRHMVREMFSDTYGGIEGAKVEFYGSDSVCIFKYLVTKSDPQYLYSLTILLLNFICFVLITGCYIVIQYFVTRSSKGVTVKTSVTRKRDLKLQTKIFIIIATDFLCWIPFSVVCLLHFFEVINASPWYPVFSIIILPFNSVINPLLYSDVITEGLKAVRSLSARWS